jgi:predicted MPP superfamily phosphohydrolase
MTDRRLLEQACASIDAAKPDVLLLGGDFVSVRGSCVSELAPLLGAIRAPLGRFAVLGNHDLRADRACIVDALESAGIEILTNRHVRLPAPHDDVAICGLDDPIRGQPDPTTTMDEEARVKIVLMHAPDGVLDLGDREFDLALCGHTHGGQITLPGGDAIVVPSGELSRRYSAGVYRLDPDGGRALLVSRGVGCSTIPIRMFANPEVHVITVG